MVRLNVYECQLPDEDLNIWRYPRTDNDIPQLINERFDSVTIDLQATPSIAIPNNADGIEVLEEETQYEENTVPWKDYLWIYSNLAKYSVVDHLVEHHDYTPLQVDQTDAHTNRVDEVYKNDPIAEPVDGLEIRQGLKIRSRFWNLPDQGPFVGINFAYTSMNYFTDPLDQVLDGVADQEYWLKMKCPADCTHEDCTFHGHDGLVGEFDDFAASGEECQYSDSGSGQYVATTSTVDGITANPPVERVAIEASYANIRRWATDKHGPGNADIIEDITRERLGIPGHLSEKKAANRETKFEYDRLTELVDGIDKDIELLTGQTLTLADEPMEVVA